MLDGTLCWSHQQLLDRGKLSRERLEPRPIEVPPAILPAPTWPGLGAPARRLCKDWDCERYAVRGSEYCKVHLK